MILDLKKLFICSFFASQLCFAADGFDEDNKASPYDLSSLLRLNEISSETEAKKLPSVACFKKDEFELRYIPAQHAFNKEDSLFNLIKEQIDTFNPNLIILEGFQNDHIRSILDSEEALNEGESIFALRHAFVKDIACVSGEPKDTDLMRRMHEQFEEMPGKSEDVFAFYLLRMLRQELRRNKNLQEQEPKLVINLIASKQEDFLGEYFSYERLMNYLQQYAISDLDLPLIKLSSGQDFITKYGSILLKFAEAIKNDMLIRDENILKLILNSYYTDKHQKILVIYGSDHYKTQLPVLEKYFGNATYLRDPFSS